MKRLIVLAALSMAACHPIQATSHACPVPVKRSPEEQLALAREHSLLEGQKEAAMVKSGPREYALYLCEVDTHDCVAADLPETLTVFTEWLNLRDQSRICAGQEK